MTFYFWIIQSALGVGLGALGGYTLPPPEFWETNFGTFLLCFTVLSFYLWIAHQHGIMDLSINEGAQLTEKEKKFLSQQDNGSCGGCCCGVPLMLFLLLFMLLLLPTDVPAQERQEAFLICLGVALTLGICFWWENKIDVKTDRLRKKLNKEEEDIKLRKRERFLESIGAKPKEEEDE